MITQDSTCQACAHFDADPGSGAGFWEIEMSYLPLDAPICAEFTEPSPESAEPES